jgi:hypothetical protein
LVGSRSDTRAESARGWAGRRAAIQALMLVVEHGGDTMLPRIGTMRALHPGDAVPTARKKRTKKYRIVRDHRDTPGSMRRCAVKATLIVFRHAEPYF